MRPLPHGKTFISERGGRHGAAADPRAGVERKGRHPGGGCCTAGRIRTPRLAGQRVLVVGWDTGVNRDRLAEVARMRPSGAIREPRAPRRAGTPTQVRHMLSRCRCVSRTHCRFFATSQSRPGALGLGLRPISDAAAAEEGRTQ